MAGRLGSDIRLERYGIFWARQMASRLGSDIGEVEGR
jgi:hypothetical protein